MSIRKEGVWETSLNQVHTLVNDFGASGTLTDWTVSGALNGNVLVLTGQSPAMTSKAFTVNPDDILVVEFSLAFTTLSDNSGVYIGSKASTDTCTYSYNTTTQKWGAAQSNANSQWNTYWLSNYNSTTRKTVKSYLLGYNVDINDVPAPEGGTVAVQLTSGTSTNIRTGYNANTGMTFEVYGFKVYNIKDRGFIETEGNAAIKSGGVNANNFIEI